MDDKLLPCPFCGGEAKIIVERMRDGNVGYDTKRVECQSCHVQTKRRICDGYYCKYYTDEEAIAEWNTRKPVENILDQLEQQRDYAIDKAKENAKNNYMNSASSEMNKALGINLAIEIIKEEGLK